MVKCGHCGNYHETVAQVRECSVNEYFNGIVDNYGDDAPEEVE